jgi:hypothetical protein
VPTFTYGVFQRCAVPYIYGIFLAESGSPANQRGMTNREGNPASPGWAADGLAKRGARGSLRLPLVGVNERRKPSE